LQDPNSPPLHGIAQQCDEVVRGASSRFYLAEPDLPEVAELRGTPHRVNGEDGVVVGTRVHLGSRAKLGSTTNTSPANMR